jgi:hypothetical protein
MQDNGNVWGMARISSAGIYKLARSRDVITIFTVTSGLDDRGARERLLMLPILTRKGLEEFQQTFWCH